MRVEGSNIAWCRGRASVGQVHCRASGILARQDPFAVFDGNSVARHHGVDEFAMQLGGMKSSGGALRWITIVISSSGASAIHSR